MPDLVRSSALLLCALLLFGLARAHGALPRLSTRGTQWVDARGNQVILKGCNLGNWLVQEMWMHAMRTEGIEDQAALERLLARRFGQAAADDLMSTYRANFITARDFALIKSFGMNVVRLPIWYALLEDDAHPYRIRPAAWVDIDRAIALAEAQGIYTILDLHGAPGGQNPWDHSGGPLHDKLWGNAEFQRRTAWLWKQFAARYRNRAAVAGYGLLNEPYTAPKEELKALMLDCYRAIRAEDPEHIVIFPSLPDGFEFYGDLRGLHHVALDAHFYPGFFGWGEPVPQVHLDWLTKGVLEWRDRVAAAGVPLLVGEMNVVLDSAGGAEMTARSFATYAGFGWATTLWSYKVFSTEGGLGDGTWGMVTNPPGEGQSLVRADTWRGTRWNVPFAQANARHETNFLAPGAGEVQMYLVIKAGASAGKQFDVALDEVTLTDITSGRQLVENGGFASGAHWTPYHHTGDLIAGYGYTGTAPRGGSGPCLHLHGAGPVNGGLFQPLTLQGGHTYTLGGVLADLGSTPEAAWIEVFLRPDPPHDGEDYTPKPAPGADIDLNHSSLADIKRYFESLSTAPYVINEPLRQHLTARSQ